MATDESFWEIRQRIYDRSQRYISFSSRRWQGPDRNRFRGGLDALHDTEEALWSLSKGLPKTEAAAKLAAYGFLQALYVQGDAVAEMEMALSLPAQALAQADVAQIRDIRNRLVGHPARRETKKVRPSTGILSLLRTADGPRLEGGIYYDDGFEVVAIDVHDYIRRMQAGLTPALVAVESAMREREEAFRESNRSDPLLKLLDYDFEYSFGKISAAARDPDRVSFALNELEMVMTHLETVRLSLSERDFLTDSPLWALDTAVGASQLLRRLAEEADEGRLPEDQWDAVVKGLRGALEDLRESLKAWDEEIAGPTEA